MDLIIIILFLLLGQGLSIYPPQFCFHFRSLFRLHFSYSLTFIFLITFSQSQIHYNCYDFNLFLLSLIFILLFISQNQLSFTCLLALSDFFEIFDKSSSCSLQQLLAYSSTSNCKNHNKLIPSHLGNQGPCSNLAHKTLKRNHK